MSKRDYYEILGFPKLPPRKKSRKHIERWPFSSTPDKNRAIKRRKKNSRKLPKLNEILSDADKRAQYDRFGHAKPGQSYGGGQNMNMEDIFSQFGDIFGGDGGPFESFFGGSGGGRSRQRKGSNLRIKLKLTLDEIANGTRRRSKYTGSFGPKVTYKNCPTCGGSGQMRKVVNT